jgi:Domain of unknown function (DUF4159)
MIKRISRFRPRMLGLPLAWILLTAALLIVPAGILFAAAQIQTYESGGIIDMDGERFPPENPNEKAEWTFARFHYDLGYEFAGRFERWAADWPKADRQFIMGVRRLTRLQPRSTEQIVDANSDDLFNWPWIYVEDGGAWQFTNAQATRLREYLMRGGFMMVDDSHGDSEWETVVDGLRMILPGRSIEELANPDELFHVVYDLDDRLQIPGTRYIWGAYRWRYTVDSATPHWRAIRDDKGRIIVAICHNSDVGDAWEWADSAQYPEHQASVAYRIGVNYIVYAMTH